MGATITDPGYQEQWVKGVNVRIYHVPADPVAFPGGVDPDSALRNGPRGFCLDLSNPSGAPVRLTIEGVPGMEPQDFIVGPGDPVTTAGAGQGRSLTANQLRSFGFRTRGDLGYWTVG